MNALMVGGIGGLATAIALREAGLVVEALESLARAESRVLV